MTRTTIVVPCHNEARRLDVKAFRHFAGRSANVQILFVNDGSRDETLAVLNRIVAENPARFGVVDLGQNCGKAEAVRRGVLHAAGTEADFIGFWDADLATPLAVIETFVEVVQKRPEASLVMGVRLPLLGHAIHRRPVRGWLGAEFARIVSLAFGQRFQDTQCGAKLFRLTPETIAAFSQPFASRWIFDVELLARLRQLWRASGNSLRESVYEYPLDQWEDVAGSKLKRGDFFKAFAELAAIWWRYLRPGAPQFVGAAIDWRISFDAPTSSTRRAA
jgi:glycosyltransferase involved in cell wall biosynthesis